MSNITAVEIAKVCHEVNRTYCGVAHDDLSHVSWELSPEWQKTSCISGVQAHLMNGDLTPADSHRLWLKVKEETGWVYGEVKDVEAKTHPCMLPYDDLPPGQKVKDYLFAAVVRALAPEVVDPMAAVARARAPELIDPMAADTPQTKGKYRVGTDFNPGGSPAVYYVKLCAADLIDEIERIPLPEGNLGDPHMNEVARLKALAQTAIEDGAMWAVKAATKREP